MRVVTNEKLIAKRAKLAKRMSLIGLVVLVAGFVISFYPKLFLLTLACLIAGFTLSNIGVFNASMWVKEPRGDQVLTRGLKGFSNKFTLFNYTGPVPHVVAGPPGAVVFLVKSHEGKIEAKGNRWRHPFTMRRLVGFFGSESLGNPARDLKASIQAVQTFLTKLLPETEIPIFGAVVFSSPKAELNLQDVDVPVLTEDELKDFMRRLPKEDALTSEEQRAVMHALQGDIQATEESE